MGGYLNTVLERNPHATTLLRFHNSELPSGTRASVEDKIEGALTLDKYQANPPPNPHGKLLCTGTHT